MGTSMAWHGLRPKDAALIHKHMPPLIGANAPSIEEIRDRFEILHLDKNGDRFEIYSFEHFSNLSPKALIWKKNEPVPKSC